VRLSVSSLYHFFLNSQLEEILRREADGDLGITYSTLEVEVPPMLNYENRTLDVTLTNNNVVPLITHTEATEPWIVIDPFFETPSKGDANITFTISPHGTEPFS
jgi:hypothetical protein